MILSNSHVIEKGIRPLLCAPTFSSFFFNFIICWLSMQKFLVSNTPAIYFFIPNLIQANFTFILKSFFYYLPKEYEEMYL